MTWTPAVGDMVAIVSRTMLPLRAEVTRVTKRHVEVTRGTVRRFSLLSLVEVDRDRWSAARIEPWTAAHVEANRHAAAIGRLRQAADDAFATGEGRARIEALPTARLDEAAAFLRALADEAKASKP